MRILYLGNNSNLVTWLHEQGESVVCQSGRLVDVAGFDFLISYNYRHIIPSETLKRFNGKAVNLHISYLPWNKGADPNLWSFLDNTHKGVAIHRLDEGIDTGDVIVQKQVFFDKGLTLSSSYDILQEEMRELFKMYWHVIKGMPPYIGAKQPEGGSYHRRKDKDFLFSKLSAGWDTPISEVEELAVELSMSASFFD